MDKTKVSSDEDVLDFWKERNIFEKSVIGLEPNTLVGKIRRFLFGKDRYIFYDGPPFATGLPHYGHILASTIKDVFPRFWTMRGKSVTRKWGWDCHGLPLEVEIEKELGLKDKLAVEEYGIGRFNQKAKDAVLRYADEWKKTIPRVGRWVDMENDYKTMDFEYMESIWSVFYKIFKKGYVKENLKAQFVCPRCETVLANHEVALGYANTEDRSVYVSMPLVDDLNTSLVIWTTTPWTLPGNTAIAINKETSYVKKKFNGRYLIVAKNKEDVVEGEIVEEIKGEDLVGLKYVPPFDYFYDIDDDKSWKVYHADYVSDVDGTGIVHLAPAYGADDMALAQENGIAIIHHVLKNGRFRDSIVDFKGRLVKEAGNPKDVDDEIISFLEKKGKLIGSNTIEHSYPFCWRCDTPLLNYGAVSWLIDVPAFREKLLAANSSTKWVPAHVRDRRFGNWLADTREWAVSRSRFWGTPLPIWKNKESDKAIIVESVREMIKYLPKSDNEYIFIRHGHSYSNEMNISLSIGMECKGLTEKGIKEIEETAKVLAGQKGKKVIISSPITRACQSAKLIAKELLIDEKDIVFDERLREFDFGDYNGKHYKYFSKAKDEALEVGGFGRKIGDESMEDVLNRVTLAIDSAREKYSGKQIIFVSHGMPITLVKLICKGIKPKGSREEILDYIGPAVSNASINRVDYRGLPLNSEGSIDLHRPFIDEIVLQDTEGNKYHYIKEVFDCWFESGAMPYASHAYPFANSKTFNPARGLGFPADFISEGIDQTRGWFYSLLAIGVGAFGVSPYKNVVVSGIILAKDGKKMSKKLKNYTDPLILIEKYGADAVRYYLLSSHVTRGENLSFSDEDVAEVERKLFRRLKNCMAFYRTYSDKPHSARKTKGHLLDRWILSRLNQTNSLMTKNFEKYEIDRAVRPIYDLVDDFSTWYVRRSRDRMRGDSPDSDEARSTMYSVLIEISKLLAPISPFTAEIIYQELKKTSDPESVHLSQWSKAGAFSQSVIDSMERSRKIVSDALEIRSKEKIIVRQPLSKLTVRSNKSLENEFLDIISDELNVKSVVIERADKESLELDCVLTEDLKKEGLVREIVRLIQNERKNNKCNARDMVKARLILDKETADVVNEYKDEVLLRALLSNLDMDVSESVSGEVKVFIE